MIKRLIIYLTACLMVISLAPFYAIAENWQQWRGPYLNGSSSEKNLPTNWSNTENVKWVAKMPGAGPSTPIIWEDKIFVSATNEEENKLWAICLNRVSGKELWKYEVGTAPGNRNGNNGSVPSPVTDGKSVYFFYSTGDMVAFDMDGKISWHRNIQRDHGEFRISFYYGGSPLLYNDNLYLAVIHRYTEARAEQDQPKPISYLLCIDSKTGKDLWKHERETDAFDESMEAYITPYPFESKDGSLIILAGADYVTAHSAFDGKETWRWGNLNPEGRGNFRLVPSVVGVGEILIFCEPRGGAIYAINGNQTGQLTEDNLLWSIYENAPDVATPLIMDGKLFVLDDRKRVITCIEAETGNIAWREKLDTRQGFQASPTGADGKIYCISMAGEVVVISVENKFELLSKIDMGEGQCRSTISVSQGQLFIKTAENLYCIGNSN